MTDFWAERGFVNPGGGQPAAFSDFAAHPGTMPGTGDMTGPDLPGDYAARLRAIELAVQLTMSKFDGGQERVMQRARSFHSFLLGRVPFELALRKEAYEAARSVLEEFDGSAVGEWAEAAVDAAWAVIIGERPV